jgi:hypothetical protein
MTLMRRTAARHRLTTILIGVVLATAVTVSSATPAAATSRSAGDRADAAAGWLARQMVGGERFESTSGGFVLPDQNLTVDAVFAFAATRTAGDFGARAMVWLARPEILSGYAGDGTFESNATATAKLALAVQVRAGDPTSFGGVDLITRLRALEQPSGRFSDRTAFGDFTGIASQSFALLALDRTAAGASPAAAAFLTAARCADGGYPLLFAQTTCVSEVEPTALAVQALIAVGRHTDAAVTLRWLLSVQHADGAFGTLSGVPNARGTGLAAQALRAGGRFVAALKARSFLTGLQEGCSSDPTRRGAVPNTVGFYDPMFTTPRSTAYAALGLSGTDLAHLSARGSRSGAPTLTCSKTKP